MVSVGVALVAVAGWLVAQPAPSQSPSMSEAPVFKYYVWGQVRVPGAYSLSAEPDILELLSAAGGPTEYANLTRVVLVRAVTRQRVSINLKKTLAAGQVISLSPGDVVMVPSSPWYYIRDGLVVVTSAAALATLVLTIMIRSGQ